LVANWMRKHRRDQQMIGVLLPPSVGGALANIGITMAGKVPVNLNFTAGREGMASAIGQCRIRTVVTSKVFLSKAKIEGVEGAVFIEDILAEAGKTAKLRGLLAPPLVRVRLLIPERSS